MKKKYSNAKLLLGTIEEKRIIERFGNCGLKDTNKSAILESYVRVLPVSEGLRTKPGKQCEYK